MPTPLCMFASSLSKKQLCRSHEIGETWQSPNELRCAQLIRERTGQHSQVRLDDYGAQRNGIRCANNTPRESSLD